MTSRRFVNLLVHHMTGGAAQAPISIHRINPANLFHPTGWHVPAPVSAEFATKVDVPLPPAEIAFQWPCAPEHDMNFIAFGRDWDKIVGMESLGRATLYDFASSRCVSITNLPNMPRSVRNPMSIAVGDNGFFLMGNYDPQFVALINGCSLSDPQFVAVLNGRDHNSACFSKPHWHWESLQQPPFAAAGPCDGNKISACTVVGKSQVWVSAAGAGTFAFDPESGAWNKIGHWALPFSGHAEYVPEHNLWFGFSREGKHICASDLTAGVSTARPPVPLKLWRDLVWPGDWTLRSSHLLPLGSGRLCIARLFITSEESEDMFKPAKIDNYVVLLGVEVVSRQGRLRFIKHKSQRYSLGQDFAEPL